MSEDTSKKRLTELMPNDPALVDRIAARFPDAEETDDEMALDEVEATFLQKKPDAPTSR